MLKTDPVLTVAQHQRFEALIRQIKPLSTDQLPYLPSYWLACAARRTALISLVAALPDESEVWWEDVVRWCHLQPAPWWLWAKAQRLPAHQIVLHEISAQRELATQVRFVEEKS